MAKCSPIALIVMVAFAAQTAEAKKYHVYFLGGQSNMDGYGKVKELPADLKTTLTQVPIFHGNTAADGSTVDGRGIWQPLQPGHGAGFKSDGKKNVYSQRFGVELTFARELKKLRPAMNVAIIKYSRGGTSIDKSAAGFFGCWEPDYSGGKGKGRGVNQYDHFLATIRHAFAQRDIDGDEKPDQLVPAGILWMQGESDAGYTKAIALRYRAHLKRLMDLIRAALRSDDLAVAVGRISDSGQDKKDGKVWNFGPIVRRAQADYVKQDGHAVLVTSTDKYGYSDPYHYDSKGYIDLGRRFANAIVGLVGRNKR